MKTTYFVNSKQFLWRWEGRPMLKKGSENKLGEGRGNGV
jgi:hypothetical protein